MISCTLLPSSFLIRFQSHRYNLQVKPQVLQAIIRKPNNIHIKDFLNTFPYSSCGKLRNIKNPEPLPFKSKTKCSGVFHISFAYNWGKNGNSGATELPKLG